LDKKVVLESIQVNLAEIKRGMLHIEKDIKSISQSIENEQFIPDAASRNVIEGLEQIEKAYDVCKGQYEVLTGDVFRFERIENFEALLAEKEEKFLQEDTIAIAKVFHKLHSKDDSTERLLDSEKAKLMELFSIINNKEDMLTKLHPYIDFVKAIKTKESTDPVLLVAAMSNLSTHFGNDLVAHALYIKDIGFAEEDDMMCETNVMPKTEANYEETNMTMREGILDQSEKDVFEINNPEEDLPEENEMDDTINNSEIVELLLNANSFLPNEYDYGIMSIDKSPREDKKFGVKDFKNDLSNGYSKHEKRILLTANKYNSITKDFIVEIANIPGEVAEQALNYLIRKGYLRKYTIISQGSFYCLTRKCERAFYSKDACSFLGVNFVADNTDSVVVEDSSSSAATRIAYVKMLETYCKLRKLTKFSAAQVLYTEAFILRVSDLEVNNTIDLFLGCFWGKKDECEKFDECLASILKGNDEILRVTFVGMDKKHTLAIANVFSERYMNLLPSKKYIYSLKEDRYYSCEDGSEIEIKEIWQTVEGDNSDIDVAACVENGQNYQTSLSDEASTANVANQFAVKEVAKVEQVFIANLNNVNDKEIEKIIPAPIVDLEMILRESLQMVICGKTYCATAYLKAYGKTSEEVDAIYNKLAYATNEPFKCCRYSSDKIFDIFFDEKNVFHDYLLVSTVLRTFFYNHVEYDYMMKSLYGNIKDLAIVLANSNLANLLYTLMNFKDVEHKGVDTYADYRMKDKVLLEANITKTKGEAKEFYEFNILGHASERASHKRFIETRKLIFAQDNDISIYIKSVMDSDYSMLSLMQDFLNENFIKVNSPINVVNIDCEKIEDYMDLYWDKAGEKMRVVKKTSDLMSSLRQNLYNSVYKAVSIMCIWIMYVERLEITGTDPSFGQYKKIRAQLLNDITFTLDYYSKKNQKKVDLAENAGVAILADTLIELRGRLDGSYNDNQIKYFYIDFLKSDQVLLDDGFLPVLDGNFKDAKELAITGRILHHSTEDLESFENRLHVIFEEYGDDYGSAKLIDAYLSDTLGHSVISENYNLKESISYAKRGAEKKRDGFIENLELAQSYGQIDNSIENKKEKILQIVNESYDYAIKTDNFGFFSKVAEAYMLQIKEDAKVREESLKKELEVYRKQLNENVTGDKSIQRLERIQKMLEVQNYTVAEDLLSRLKSDESDADLEISSMDYLCKFLTDYDYYYNKVADSSRSLNFLISTRTRNKDDRGAKRLAEAWMESGQKLNAEKLRILLQTLGFSVNELKEQVKIGKYDNCSVTLKKPINGRKASLKHPIAAFGSKAAEEGFRIVLLVGKYDADRLIEVIKDLGSAKNTIILLDYALTINDRRRLARKTKSDVQDKIFGIIDRVLFMFLVSNYNEEYMNKMLMSIMMPFAYYQPYVWESANVMPPEIFMGRKEELEKIESPKGVNIVYGGRQLGKSALLKMAKNDIDKNENGDRAILVEIKGLDYKKAATKIGHALYDEGILDDDTTTDDWDELARIIKKRLLVQNEKKIPYLLLLLDEADAFIESCEVVNYHPFDALKDVQSVGVDRFKFAIAGLRNIIRFKRETALGNNSVLTHLEAMTVKPLKVAEARELLEVPLYYLGLRFPKDKESLISLIFASANYFPGLIQLYCAKLVEAMRKGDYAGYDECDTPAYEVQESHIKKVLADKGFMKQIREKYEITLKLDEDNYYYIIALLVAQLYHENGYNSGYTPYDVFEEGNYLGVSKIMKLNIDKLAALMEELCELNVLRKTSGDEYLFNRFSFFQMMGSQQEVEDKLMEYMGE
jgi:hypothetical protein